MAPQNGMAGDANAVTKRQVFSDVRPDEETKFSHGTPPYDIHLTLKKVGGDLLASVTGGTRPHIGAAALAEPALSFHPVTGEPYGADEIRVSLLTAAGHKDAILAETFARALCEHTGAVVCCTAGVHIDGATAAEIARMVENAQGLIQTALQGEAGLRG